MANKPNYKFSTNYGVKLDFEPVAGHLDPNEVWVCQHWQARPKPGLGQKDVRHFGYLVSDGSGSLKYMTIPYNQCKFKGTFTIEPLQVDKVDVVPTAVNLLRGVSVVREDGVWVLTGQIQGGSSQDVLSQPVSLQPQDSSELVENDTNND